MNRSCFPLSETSGSRVAIVATVTVVAVVAIVVVGDDLHFLSVVIATI